MPKKIREEDMSKALFPDRGKGPDPAMPKTDFARALPVILTHHVYWPDASGCRARNESTKPLSMN